MNINESIHLESHNPQWRSLYENEFKQLSQLEELSCFKFEHIGSTSIPDIKSKPIIDILLGVSNLPVPHKVIKALERCGYIYMEAGSVDNRQYFVKRGIVNFNVQAVVYGSKIWTDDLSFRDYLTTHTDKALKYQQIKEQIINNGTTTLLEYSNQKADFISKILEEIHSGTLSI